MPFFLRYGNPRIAGLPGGRSGTAFSGGEPDWRPVSASLPVEAWHRNPCGVWDGTTTGSNCLLLFEGFVSHPRPADTSDPQLDIQWLAEFLYRLGADAVDDLKGQYTVCFFNGDTGELVAARDRLGGRTLYWHHSSAGIAIASRSRDLARLGGGGALENPAFMTEMFALRGQHTPGGTPFSSVHEVLPGGRVVSRAWEVEAARPAFNAGNPAWANPEDWVAAFHEAFQNAVSHTLGRQGDVAVMLSGGMDSVPVLSAASSALHGRGRRVAAISWILPNCPESDESEWIQMAADGIGTELETFDGGQFAPFSDLTSAVSSPELPYYNSVRGLLLECYRQAAARQYAVVLAATRGDMIYAQRFAMLDDLIRRRDWPRLWAELGCLYRRIGIGGMYRDASVRYPVARIRKRLFGDRLKPVPGWLTEYAVEHIPDPVAWPPEAGGYPVPDHARQMLGPALTFGTAQENDFSQRCGIERRDPFHNEALIGLMLYAPIVFSHMKGETKWIMREAMRGRIPEPIRVKARTGNLTRFVRAGFDQHRSEIRELLLDQDESDWARYVRPAFVREVLASPQPPESGLMVVCACIGYTLWRDYWDMVQ